MTDDITRDLIADDLAKIHTHLLNVADYADTLAMGPVPSLRERALRARLLAVTREVRDLRDEYTKQATPQTPGDAS